MRKILIPILMLFVLMFSVSAYSVNINSGEHYDLLDNSVPTLDENRSPQYDGDFRIFSEDNTNSIEGKWWYNGTDWRNVNFVAIVNMSSDCEVDAGSIEWGGPGGTGNGMNLSQNNYYCVNSTEGYYYFLNLTDNQINSDVTFDIRADSVLPIIPTPYLTYTEPASVLPYSAPGNNLPTGQTLVDVSWTVGNLSPDTYNFTYQYRLQVDTSNVWVPVFNQVIQINSTSEVINLTYQHDLTGAAPQRMSNLALVFKNGVDMNFVDFMAFYIVNPNCDSVPDNTDKVLPGENLNCGGTISVGVNSTLNLNGSQITNTFFGMDENSLVANFDVVGTWDYDAYQYKGIVQPSNPNTKDIHNVRVENITIVEGAVLSVSPTETIGALVQVIPNDYSYNSWYVKNVRSEVSGWHPFELSIEDYNENGCVGTLNNWTLENIYSEKANEYFQNTFIHFYSQEGCDPIIGTNLINITAINNSGVSGLNPQNSDYTTIDNSHFQELFTQYRCEFGLNLLGRYDYDGGPNDIVFGGFNEQDHIEVSHFTAGGYEGIAYEEWWLWNNENRLWNEGEFPDEWNSIVDWYFVHDSDPDKIVALNGGLLAIANSSTQCDTDAGSLSWVSELNIEDIPAVPTDLYGGIGGDNARHFCAYDDQTGLRYLNIINDNWGWTEDESLTTIHGEQDNYGPAVAHASAGTDCSALPSSDYDTVINIADMGAMPKQYCYRSTTGAFYWHNFYDYVEDEFFGTIYDYDSDQDGACQLQYRGHILPNSPHINIYNTEIIDSSVQNTGIYVNYENVTYSNYNYDLATFWEPNNVEYLRMVNFDATNSRYGSPNHCVGELYGRNINTKHFSSAGEGCQDETMPNGWDVRGITIHRDGADEEGLGILDLHPSWRYDGFGDMRNFYFEDITVTGDPSPHAITITTQGIGSAENIYLKGIDINVDNLYAGVVIGGQGDNENWMGITNLTLEDVKYRGESNTESMISVEVFNLGYVDGYNLIDVDAESTSVNTGVGIWASGGDNPGWVDGVYYENVTSEISQSGYSIWFNTKSGGYYIGDIHLKDVTAINNENGVNNVGLLRIFGSPDDAISSLTIENFNGYTSEDTQALTTSTYINRVKNINIDGFYTNGGVVLPYRTNNIDPEVINIRNFVSACEIEAACSVYFAAANVTNANISGGTSGVILGGIPDVNVNKNKVYNFNNVKINKPYIWMIDNSAYGDTTTANWYNSEFINTDYEVQYLINTYNGGNPANFNSVTWTGNNKFSIWPAVASTRWNGVGTLPTGLSGVKVDVLREKTTTITGNPSDDLSALNITGGGNNVLITVSGVTVTGQTTTKFNSIPRRTYTTLNDGEGAEYSVVGWDEWITYENTIELTMSLPSNNAEFNSWDIDENEWATNFWEDIGGGSDIFVIGAPGEMPGHNGIFSRADRNKTAYATSSTDCSLLTSEYQRFISIQNMTVDSGNRYFCTQDDRGKYHLVQITEFVADSHITFNYDTESVWLSNGPGSRPTIGEYQLAPASSTTHCEDDEGSLTWVEPYNILDIEDITNGFFCLRSEWSEYTIFEIHDYIPSSNVALYWEYNVPTWTEEVIPVQPKAKIINSQLGGLKINTPGKSIFWGNIFSGSIVDSSVGTQFCNYNTKISNTYWGSYNGVNLVNCPVADNFEDSPATTDFEEVEDWNNVTLVLDAPEAQVDFSEEIDLFTEATNTTISIDFDAVVIISERSIEVKVDVAPQLQKPAVLKFKNAGYTRVEEVLVYRDGVLCPPSVCRDVRIVNGAVQVNVTGFSTYTLVDNVSYETYTASRDGMLYVVMAFAILIIILAGAYLVLLLNKGDVGGTEITAAILVLAVGFAILVATLIAMSRMFIY